MDGQGRRKEREVENTKAQKYKNKKRNQSESLNKVVWDERDTAHETGAPAYHRSAFRKCDSAPSLTFIPGTWKRCWI